MRTKLATVLKNIGWQINEKVHCVASNGSSRRVDIFALSKNSKQGIITDATIKMEQGHKQSPAVNVAERHETLLENK